MSLPRASSRWDDRRNTSAFRPSPPGSHRDALQAVADFRRREPELVRWIEDGHPHLTDAEHVRRFGKPYDAGRAKRR